ncbi:HAD family hydrolase [Candidatus Pacebacteria bacterium]|nr:HAD family hydrolase [Candidatus Paceibacterota bacterium]
MIKHIIFDYDGVLVDSFNFHLTQYNQLLHLGLEAQELRDAHNGNFHDNESNKLGNIDINRYVDAVKENQESLPLRPGVKETLTELANTKQLHLVTSGYERQILPNLANHGIDTFFTYLLFADHGHHKHEKIQNILDAVAATSDEAIFVTDTLGDIHEAKQVPISTIALSCGFHPRETLLEGQPEFLLDSWKELAATLLAV